MRQYNLARCEDVLLPPTSTASRASPFRSWSHSPTCCSGCISAPRLLQVCNVALAGLPAPTSAPLQSPSRGSSICVHVTMRHMHWLSVTQRIQYKLCMLVVHKRFYRPVTVIPRQPVDCHLQRAARTSLRASGNGNLVVPRTNHLFGEHAFSVAAPRAYNSRALTVAHSGGSRKKYLGGGRLAPHHLGGNNG